MGRIDNGFSIDKAKQHYPELVQGEATRIAESIPMYFDGSDLKDRAHLKSRIGQSVELVGKRFSNTVVARVASGEVSKEWAEKIWRFFPTFLAFASLSKTGVDGNFVNEPAVMANFFGRMLSMESGINLVSPLCPGYNYVYDEKLGGLKHQNGLIVPFVSDYRTARTMKVIDELFSTLGVPVNLQLLTYSGENGMDGLIELGGDVKTTYRGRQDQLINDVRSHYASLQDSLGTLGDLKVLRPQVSSIESTVYAGAQAIVDSFFANFPDFDGQIPNFNQEFRIRLEQWVYDCVGFGNTMDVPFVVRKEDYSPGVAALKHFMSEQEMYADKQRFADEDPAREGIQEFALYVALARHQMNSGSLELGLETTSQYRLGLQGYMREGGLSPNALMMNPYAVKNPLGTGIRQPFTHVDITPQMLEFYKNNGIPNEVIAGIVNFRDAVGEHTNQFFAEA